MPVTQNCAANLLVVQLAAAAHQQLRHRVDGDAAVAWTLVDQTGRAVCAPPLPASCTWTSAAVGTQQYHSLSMAFAAANALRWRVELLDGRGTVIQTLKDCTYTNVAGASNYYDALTINVV